MSARADELKDTIQSNDFYIISELNQQALALFDKQYPDYKIFDYCKGNYTHFNAKEYLLETFSPDKKTYY